MKKKIFNSIFFIALALIVIITAVVTFNVYSSQSKSQIERLKEESQLVVRGVELTGKTFFDDFEFENYRITWIKDDGEVLYDTKSDSSGLGNHMEREEVKEALETGYGQSKRYSETILKESLYVAFKISDGSIIRLSCIQHSAIYLVVSSLYPLYYVAFIALVAAIIIAFAVSKKIIDPINKIDLDNISNTKVIPEVEPLLNRIDIQHKQLINDKIEIENASKLRQEFTANVTHEMKTPLHIISGYSELLKEGLVKNEEIKTFSTKIFYESYRMSKLVDDILQLSKLDNGLVDEEKQKISLDSITKNVIDSLESVALEKNIEIKAKLDSAIVFGAANIIHSMIYNLVENAIKYNKENGEVDVIVEMINNHPTISITDTGIGVPNEELDRIFERFYRVDKSHSKDIGGTGLGLSIVKHAAKIHNAKIDVESTLGYGSTFKIIF